MNKFLSAFLTRVKNTSDTKRVLMRVKKTLVAKGAGKCIVINVPGAIRGFTVLTLATVVVSLFSSGTCACAALVATHA